MLQCPSCDINLRGAKICECGWREKPSMTYSFSSPAIKLTEFPKEFDLKDKSQLWGLRLLKDNAPKVFDSLVKVNPDILIALKENNL